MKRFLLILFLLKILFVKSQENNTDKNTIKTIIGIIDKRDSNCLSEIKKAEIKFNHKEIFYYIEPEGYLDSNSIRHHIILGELLKQKGIQFLTSTESELSSLWAEINGKKYPLKTNCYCKSFNELLNLKYGHDFTKNIEYKADSLYVIKRIEIPFEYPYGVDHYCIIYPNAKDFLDQKEQMQKDFFSSFKFPSTFIFSEQKRDFMARSKFIITKENQISNIVIKIEFKNQQNQKFENYIINKLTKFIENANWKAAVSSGIKVNSSFEVNFYN